jgi:hypothetical protein
MRAPIPSLPSRNVRNKKTRNPGYIGGNHWVICDRCGCAIRVADSRITWEGYVVCLDDWEPRHPQDFVRAREDRIAPEGPVRPDLIPQAPSAIDPHLRLGVAGYAIAGYAIAGVTVYTEVITVPPQGNNNNDL